MPDIGFWLKSNLDSLSPVANQTLGFQSTVTSGRGVSLYSRDSAWRGALFADYANVKDFGAMGDGVTNDHAAFYNALNSGRRVTFVPMGTYLVNSTLVLPPTVAMVGQAYPRIKKGFNGDLLDMSAITTGIYGLDLQGDGANRTGRGIIVTSGYDQVMQNCTVFDCSSYCLDFTAGNAGQRFRGIASDLQQTSLANYSIKMPTNSADDNGNRLFFGISTQGGALMDMGASTNTHILDCNFSFQGLTMTGSCSRCLISNNRIAILGNSITIHGYDHVVANNVIAGGLIASSDTARCVITGNALIQGASVEDYSLSFGDNMNIVYHSFASFTPLWKGDVSNPAIGSGTMTGRLYRNGKHVLVQGQVIIAGDTTFGSGQWYFQLPAPFSLWTAKHASVGAAKGYDVGTAHRAASTVMYAGDNKIYIFGDNQGSAWKSDVPHTWTSSDYFEWSLSFEMN